MNQGKHDESNYVYVLCVRVFTCAYMRIRVYKCVRVCMYLVVFMRAYVRVYVFCMNMCVLCVQ